MTDLKVKRETDGYLIMSEPGRPPAPDAETIPHDAGWREVCEEIITAGAETTARPWGNDDETVPWGGGHFPAIRVTWEKDRCVTSPVAMIPDANARAWGGSYKPRQDAAYITISANHADKLARFALTLAGWAEPPPGEDRLQFLKRIWEECV